MIHIKIALILVLLALALVPAPGLGQDAKLDAPIYADHLDLLKVVGKDGVIIEAKKPDDWKIRREQLLKDAQAVMGPLPGPERQCPLDMKSTETVLEAKYYRKRITYASEPKDRVPAWLLIPMGLRNEGKVVKKAPAILALHQTTGIGKDEPTGLGGLANLHYAQELAEQGFVVLAPDYPGFGDHKIDVYSLGYASATMKGVWDHMRGVDLLCSLPEVNPEQIGVIGHSLGGHNAIFVAAFDQRIKAVVSSCGFTRFPRYYHGNLAGWSHNGYMPRLKSKYDLDPKKVPFDFPDLIASLAPRAFYTNSPLHDDNFDVQGVRETLDAARKVYKLWDAVPQLQAAFPDAAHDFPKTQREEAYQFLKSQLGVK